jgi:hypothetical protein
MAFQKRRGPPPRDAGGDPQKIEQLPGRLSIEFTLSAFDLQTKKIARQFGLTDAAALALAPLIFGEAAR